MLSPRRSLPSRKLFLICRITFNLSSSKCSILFQVYKWVTQRKPNAFQLLAHKKNGLQGMWLMRLIIAYTIRHFLQDFKSVKKNSRSCFIFLKVFQVAGRKIDEIQFNQFNKQKIKPMKRILVIFTAVATTVIMSCNSSKSSTNNSNPSTTDTTSNMNNGNMNNNTDTTQHR